MALQMGFGLIQEQRMKLVMTPELRQAIQILQYSAADLLQYMEQQMAENPVLELGEQHSELEDQKHDELRQQIQDFIKYLQDAPTYYGWTNKERSGKDDWVERVSNGSDSLAQVLESQLCYYHLDSKLRSICLYLIHNLDERGYLEIEPIHLCKRFQIKEETVSEALRILHSLDPAGVGARSLSECLEIQLLRKENVNPLAIEIAKRFLPEVAEGKLKKIAQILDVEVAQVQQAIDQIKTCNPRPGSSYSSTPSSYIYPDVVVEQVDDEYVVVLNESDMPRFNISTSYQQLLAKVEHRDDEASAYLKNWLQSALWLVKGIEQRRDTIYRVAETIVSKQQAFFKEGTHGLKPLTLKQVAEELDLHESTVSRATQHKYMQTPRGLFPFRFFFPTGLSTEYGEDLSSQTVKKKIQQLIESEDKTNPLSDQKISDQLKADGIRISRRTVAKYREELKIPSSAVRKRY